MSAPNLGFIPEPVTVALNRILPSKKAPEGILTSRKFKQITASIEAVGLIEPLTVAKADRASDQHVLLDGHVRLIVMQQLGFADTPCLVAMDDESYTYNNRINRISTIQEHMMLRRAIERGVTPEKLAVALSVDISQIHKKANLLEGVCVEAAELLKDQHFAAGMGGVLRKMKPTRQIEVVELMLATNNITVAYANALVAATPPQLLIGESKPRKVGGVTPEQMAKMEKEMGNLHGQFKLVEQSYGNDVLNLTLVKGYLAKLLDNRAVVRFLSQRVPDVLAEFENIVQTVSLEK